MEQQHSDSVVMLYSGGAMYAVNYEFAGIVSIKNYIDAQNMRLTSGDNNELVLRKIGGEELLYSATWNPCNPAYTPVGSIVNSYHCIYANTINGYLFEVWATNNGLYHPFFRINGKVVAYSSGIPFAYNVPLKGDKNESCNGGEVFLTDGIHCPQIYNIKDLMENGGLDYDTGGEGGTCSAKYFIDYNAELYNINLKTQGDHPVFIEVTAIQPQNCIAIGSGGLVAGSVQYCIAYQDNAGNRTGWSEPTPLINIPQHIGSNNPIYPFAKTYGGAAQSPTVMGCHIRFRITNLNDYSYIVLRKITHDSGAPMGSVGRDEVVYKLPINPQQIGVADIYDIGASGEAVTISNLDDQIAPIVSAGDVRYFANRLWLGDVSYESKITELELANPELPVMYAIYNMGVAGHKDMWHQTYKKSYMHGEQYGFSVRTRDGIGTNSFNQQFEDWLQVNMPQRRDTAVEGTNLSEENPSALSPDQKATSDHSDFSPEITFDCWSSEFQSKDDFQQFKNIMDLGHGTDYKTKSSVTAWASDVIDPNAYIYDVVGTDYVGVRYAPFKPIQQDDESLPSYEMPINTSVSTNGTDWLNYTPQGFSQRYHSLGVALSPISRSSFPSWATSFAIDRTKAADKIFAQAFCFYSLIPKDAGNGNSDRYAQKISKTMWMYIPDSSTGLVDVQELLDNKDNFAIHFQCGLGMFGETYSDRTITLGVDAMFDIIEYAKIYYEHGQINTGDSSAQIGTASNGYVDPYSWRNQVNVPSYDYNGEIDITSIKWMKTFTQRGVFFEIELDEEMWGTLNVSAGDNQFDDASMREWHSPVYVVNIVRKNREIDVNVNQQKYYPTGTYIKLDSIIGRQESDAVADYYYPLVDERWEDCIQRVDTNTFDLFVWVKDTYGQEKKWVNIQYKTGGEITSILADIVAGTGTYGDCGGVYYEEVENDEMGNPRYYSIVFKGTEAGMGQLQYYIPSIGSKIIVKYDDANRPLYVYGGDTYIGESTCAFIDGKGKKDGDNSEGENSENFYLKLGLPYLEWETNSRYYIPNNTSGNQIQSREKVKLGWIRQLCFMWTSETRANIPLCFNAAYPYRYFPLQNYVIRPTNYDPDKTMVEQDVFRQYSQDYPEELTSDGKPAFWDYGGLRFIQNDQNHNIDYCKTQENFVHYSAPKSGFEEYTHYGTRIHPSAKRNTYQQNAPSLKTFLWSAAQDIDDSTGKITKLWSAVSSKGNNLYAITEGGICIAITNKFIARQINGDELGLIQPQGGEENIQEELWISRNQGLPQQTWRTFAEYNEVCWFTNKNSVWRLEGAALEDIGRQYYLSRIYNNAIKFFDSGYNTRMEASFNFYNGEYWLFLAKEHPIVSDKSTYYVSELIGINNEVIECTDGATLIVPDAASGFDKFQVYTNFGANTVTIKNNSGGTIGTITTDLSRYRIKKVYPYGDSDWTITLDPTPAPNYLDITFTFVYLDKMYDKEGTGKWVGYFDYAFDQTVCQNNIMYGMKMAKTYQLGVDGQDINGNSVKGKVWMFVTGVGLKQVASKEFWRLRVQTNKVKPTKFTFYDSIQHMIADSEQATVTSGNIKDYGGGYEQYIPRKADLPNYRFQGTAMIIGVENSNNNNLFYIVNTEVKFKNLK